MNRYHKIDTMNILKIVSIILLAVFLSNCSEYPKDTEILRVSKAAIKSQFPDTGSEVVIGPVDATAQTIITLRVNNDRLNNGEIIWYVNGIRDASSKGPRFIPKDIEKGDIVQAVILDGTRKYYSNEIIIKNTPPVILRAALLPDRPKVSSTLTVDLQASDVDNDNVSFKYQWALNGKFAGEESYLETELKRGDSITVKITPYDGEDYGKSITLQSSVVNSLPVISESEPVYDGKTYRYRIAASDPDNDPLTFKLQDGPEGMHIDPSTGLITWEVGPDFKGIYEAKVLISDNNGGTILVPFTTAIGFAKKE